MGFASAGELRRAGARAVSKLLAGEWSHPDETGLRAVRMAEGLDDDVVKERPLVKQARHVFLSG